MSLINASYINFFAILTTKETLQLLIIWIIRIELDKISFIQIIDIDNSLSCCTQ